MGDALKLTKPVSVWNKPLKANFRHLFKSLGKVAIDLPLGNWAGLARDLLEVPEALGLKEEPGQVAWLLIYRSLTAAMAELMEEQRHLLQLNEQDLDNLCESLDLTLEDRELTLDREFFQAPEQLSLLEDIKLPFCQWLRQLGVDEGGGSAIATRLPTYFREALEKEWCQHPEAYDTILQRFHTPFSQANQQGRAWLRYSSWLQKQITVRNCARRWSCCRKGKRGVVTSAALLGS